MFPLTYQVPPIPTTTTPSSSPSKNRLQQHPSPSPPTTPTPTPQKSTVPTSPPHNPAPAPAPDLTLGFTSPAYTSHSATSPIVLLEPVTYSPISPDDEIVLRTTAVAICASDLKAAAGKFHGGVSPPLILGHECAGVVAAVGSGVRRLKAGDKVVLSYDACGKCGMCAHGERAYCVELARRNMACLRSDGGMAGWVSSKRENGEEKRRDGVEGEGERGRMPIKGHFFGQSSMGRMIVARETCAVKLADDTTEEEMRLFASLGCGIQTGVGAILNVARPGPNSSICIFGAGSVGLAACLAARLTSPQRLVVVDNSPAKLAMLPESIKKAVTDLVDSSGLEGEAEFVERLKSLTNDGIGFDYVLDCVGKGQLVKVGHLALRQRGTIITVGGSPEMALQVSLSQHLARGITCRGSHQGDSVPSISIPLMIDLWRQGKFPFEELLTFYEFTEFDQAVADLKQGKVIKPVLVNREKQ